MQCLVWTQPEIAYAVHSLPLLGQLELTLELLTDVRRAEPALPPNVIRFPRGARHDLARAGRVCSSAVFAAVPPPMLARLDSVLPGGPEWVYEPKLEGFRGLLWRSDTGTLRLPSRNLKELSTSFPELIQAAETLSLDTIVDGEIVIADAHGNSDSGALQQRLSAGKRDALRAASERPATLLTFDVLRNAGVCLTDQPLRHRRTNLEALIRTDAACLQQMTQTADVAEAEDWLKLLPNIEGVVAKRRDSRYLSGQRDWVKVKRRRTADSVVIGVAVIRHAPGSHSDSAIPTVSFTTLAWRAHRRRSSLTNVRHCLPRPDQKSGRSDRTGSTLRCRSGAGLGRPLSARLPTQSLTATTWRPSASSE